MSKLVLADYFLGFSTREISGGARPWRLYYESEEEAGLKPARCNAAFSGDLYLNGDIKEIASTYYPAIGPYDVEDVDVAEYHVLLAKSAGIDGFMAEFTMGQEKKLLSLVSAAKKYDFKVGVNWITQSHLAENEWPDRATAIAKAHELVRWMVEHVYKPCGVRYHERDLLMIFLAHPREATKPFDPFFSPTEVRQLKQTAVSAGSEMDIFVLPWEPLSDDSNETQRVWDGYFPWVWSSSGAAIAEDACWSRMTTREQYIERVCDYYAMCRRLQKQGRIGGFIGAVLPGFDDHKGQAWGEGLKRYLPRDDGQTLKETWAALRSSDVDAALIITWNDWIESSQIEPSLELGDADLIESAKQIADWKQQSLDASLLSTPARLLEARRALRFISDAGIESDATRKLSAAIDQAAGLLGARSVAPLREMLSDAESRIAKLKAALTAIPIHLFWEFGFDSIGIRRFESNAIEKITVDTHTGVKLGSATNQIGFLIDEPIRSTLRSGQLVGASRSNTWTRGPISCASS